MGMVWISRCIRFALPVGRLSRNFTSPSFIFPHFSTRSTTFLTRNLLVHSHTFRPCDVEGKFTHSLTATPRPSENSNGEASSQERLGVEVTADNYVVKYVEEENEYFHEFIECNPNYQRYILNPNAHQIQASQTPASAAGDALPPAAEAVLAPYVEGAKFQMASVLRDLESLLSLELGDSDLLFKNSHFMTLCDCLVESVPSISDEDLFQSMEILSKFNFRRCIVTGLRVSRMRFTRCFNDECIRRCSEWDLPQLLLAADFFYSLRTSQRSPCLPKLFKQAEQYLPSASKEEMVLLLYHANLARQPPWPRNTMEKVALAIHESINTVTVQECGIVCLSFFKTQQLLKHHELLVEIAKLLNEHIATIDPVCLSAILKCLQMSTNKTMVKGIPEFFELMVQLEPKAQRRLADLPPGTIVHIMAIFHHLHNVSEDLVQAVCEVILTKGFADWRMKDLAGVARFLGCVQLDLPSRQLALAHLVKELESAERREELSRHLDSLLGALLSLAFCDIYRPSLLDLVFSEEGQKALQEAKMDFRRDLHHLVESVGIEASHCAPPPLPPRSVGPPSQKAGSLQWKAQKGTKVSERDKLLAEVVNLLVPILGRPDCMKVHNLLASVKIPDIELQLHPCGKPMPVTKWQNGSTGVNKTVPSGDNVNQDDILGRLLKMATAKPVKRIAVLIHGHNAHYTLRTANGESSYRLLGPHIMKGRQLQKLGYHVVQIPFYEFAEVQEKKDYIKMKVFGDIHFDDLD